MTIKELFITYFEWTEEEFSEKADVLRTHIPMDKTILLKRVGFYQKEFGLERSEIIKIIRVAPMILGYTEENVKNKMAFYHDYFGLDKSEFVKIIKSFPTMLGNSEDNIKTKMIFMQEEFGLDKSEVVKMFKVSPVILSYMEDTLKNKVKFYQEEFDLEKSEFIKMLKILPSLLVFSEENIKNKAEFYQKELNLRKIDFIKVVKRLPALLSYSEESVRCKIQFYQEEFDLQREDVLKILITSPALFGCSKGNIKEKHKQIKGLNIQTSDIIKDPNILTAPTNTLKIRYAILRNVASREEILSTSSWYMTNQNKLYARLAYLLSREDINPDLKTLLIGETKFVRKFKVSSEDLMKEYRLIESDLMIILSVFEEEMEKLTEEERSFIKKEYGE